MSEPASGPIADFVRRAESGARAACKPLAEALRARPDLVPEAAALVEEGSLLAARGAAEALGLLAQGAPDAVAPHAGALVKGAAHEDARLREASLEALAHVAAHAPGAVAPGIDALVDAFRRDRRAAARASAALCLARLGLAPDLRPRVLPEFVGHMRRNPRDKQARDILVAMGELAKAADLAAEERAELAGAVAPLRGHPNLQVRERAGRIWRELDAREAGPK